MRRPLATLAAFLVLVAPAQAWVWPVSGEVITPYRNGTDPYASGQHRGIDIAAPVGMPVVAAAGGDVLFAGTAGSSGVTVSVRTGAGYDTSYLHLSSVDVRKGARVSAGQRIGAVGTTGTRSAAEPHLHFGVRDAGTRHAYHDPLAFLPQAPPSSTPEPPAAPAPAFEPAPPAPAPHPEPAPLHESEPGVRPAPRPLPRPAPRGAPRHAPRRVPRPAPQGAPRAAPHGLPRGTRLPEPASLGAVKHVPHHTSQAARPRGTHERGAPAPLGPTLGARPHDPARAEADSSAAHSPRSSAPGHAGPDIGWALACAGLLLAAAVLTLTGRRDGGGASSSARGRLTRALPLLGRR